MDRPESQPRPPLHPHLPLQPIALALLLVLFIVREYGCDNQVALSRSSGKLRAARQVQSLSPLLRRCEASSLLPGMKGRGALRTASSVLDKNVMKEEPLHKRRIDAKALLLLTGITFNTLLGGLNRVKVHHGERLINAVERRPNGTGLFTVSNHASMLDPAIIAAMYPWQRDMSFPQWPPWTLCTDTFFDSHPSIAFWLTAGKAMPITRASPKGLKQRYLRDFRDKLDAGEWCHLYPEGKITQPWRFKKGKSKLGKFLPGIGKIVTTCKNIPMVVPIYHRGMHNILPEVEGDPKLPAKPKSIIPKIGKNVDIYVGEPVDLSDLFPPHELPIAYASSAAEWTHESRDDLKKWLAISKRVQEAMRNLEAEAWRDVGEEIEPANSQQLIIPATNSNIDGKSILEN